jgi:beta-glucuronidase
VRKIQDLNGPWRFQPDPYGEGDHEGFERPDWDDSQWFDVDVPCDFSTVLPDLDFYEGGGWYRRSLDVPECMRGRCNLLRFEGVNHRCRVWLNGQLVGEHFDAYLPFEIRVDDSIEYGARNSLVVYADNTCHAEDVPGEQRGWRTFGGLVRSVALVSMSRLHLSHIATDARADGTLNLQADVTNELNELASTAIDVRLKPRITRTGADVPLREGESGPEIEGGGGALDITPGSTADFQSTTTFPDIQAWSPDSPTLYDLTVSLSHAGDVIDARTVTIGFRTIEARAGQLLLNGDPIYLTGFNRHEDSPCTAMAPDPELTRQDLVSMKSAGSNFVRLCHYPHDPGELDLCDALGLLVLDEIPLYWWGGKWDEEHYESKFAAAKRQVEKMVRRDVNHPCVAFWSVSNETSEKAPGVVEGNRELVKLVQGLDPTRPAVHVSNHWTEVREFDADDVICINAYPAWGRMHKGGKGGFTLEDATAWWSDELEKLHECYPDKPILIAEFGHPCLAGVKTGSLGEFSQCAALEAEFKAMHAPYVCGATVWCYADHPWPGGFSFMKYMTTSTYGVVTRSRQPKRAYETMRRLFTAKRANTDAD